MHLKLLSMMLCLIHGAALICMQSELDQRINVTFRLLTDQNILSDNVSSNTDQCSREYRIDTVNDLYRFVGKFVVVITDAPLLADNEHIFAQAGFKNVIIPLGTVIRMDGAALFPIIKLVKTGSKHMIIDQNYIDNNVIAMRFATQSECKHIIKMLLIKQAHFYE